LNLLKALQSLSAQDGRQENAKTDPAEKPQTPPPPQQTEKIPQSEYPNVMASVLERHEQVSNRIKNRR